MDRATSVKGAKYFGFDNVVYLHGPVNEDAIKLHSKCKKLLCALSGIGRSAGAQPESDTETAENLSKLSLKYKNIKGGIIDDLIQSYGRHYSCRDIENIYNALKKHNSELDLYAVVYAHELDLPSVKAFEPFIDCVNLWFWLRSDLADLAVRLAGVHRGGHRPADMLRAVLAPAGLGPGATLAATGLSSADGQPGDSPPPREHRPPAGRDGEQDRQEAELGRRGPIGPCADWLPHTLGGCHIRSVGAIG